jgi:DNA topoisomerase I
MQVRVRHRASMVSGFRGFRGFSGRGGYLVGHCRRSRAKALPGATGGWLRAAGQLAGKSQTTAGMSVKSQRGTPLSPAMAVVREAGLRYGTDRLPGIRRRRAGRGFTYAAEGKAPVDRRTIERIRKLVIPPAWTDVWISSDPESHLQVTGRDAKGRKQHRYHARWSVVRDRQKFDHLLAFADALAAIRRQVNTDLKQPPLSQKWVLATVVRILDRAVLRIGNEEYAKANGSYGLTTLRNRHVRVRGGRVHFRFRAKSGVLQRIDVADPELARAVRKCQELPGQLLFQYLDSDGAAHSITSTDVNDYLRSVGGPDVSAKEFRTWAATLAAARGLCRQPLGDTLRARRSVLVQVIDDVAGRLGNTRAVCRKSYIHPEVLRVYEAGRPLNTNIGRASRDVPPRTGLNAAERALREFLHARRPGVLKAA